MKVSCEILTLGQRIYQGEIGSISIPTTDGQIEVLPKHEPLVTALGDGELQIKTDSKRESFAVSSGFVKILPDKIMVFAEMAERAEAINAAEAQAAVAKAQSEMKQGTVKGAAYQQAAVEYRRMLLRLNVARKRRKI